MMLQEFRCSKCNKLLGKIEGRAEIVCMRCRTKNYQELLRTGEKTVNDIRKEEGMPPIESGNMSFISV